jgi:CubicO group peptidase (beta-lactamase class C family)
MIIGGIQLASVALLVVMFASSVHAQSRAKPNPAVQAVPPGANERSVLNLWPGGDWPTATQESQGMSSARLDLIKDRLAAKKTRAFLVVRNDHLVYEWYGPGVTATTKQGTASLAKALAGGMSLVVAITDGKISIDDPAARFVPQWKSDPRKSKITVRHLGSHTSGLSDSTTENVKHEEQPGWMGDFWKRLDPPRDPFTLARDETPMLLAPGEKLQYSNPGIGMMTYCVTAAIHDGEHKDIRTLLRERVMWPIGVPDAEWSVGYGKTFTVDGLPLVATWGGGAYTPRATARIGRLVLHEGNWEGRQILSKDAIRQVTGDGGVGRQLRDGLVEQRRTALPQAAQGRRVGCGRGRPIVARGAEPESHHGAQRRDAHARAG